MRMLALLVAGAGLLLAADDPSKSELDKYQGTWVLISEEFEGKRVSAERLPDLTYTVRGDKIFFTSNGKDRSAIVKLDPSKTPKTYDLLRDDGRLSLKGIYTWDGDDIRICSADDQGGRPAELRTEPGSKNRIRVLKRRK
jgi:uncharacterized protein (TIGR03067 family)